jgi:hypothetical protein
MQAMIDKTTSHHDSKVVVWVEVMRAIWWMSVLWLAVEFLVLVYLFAQWAALKEDPQRYETVIVSAFVFYGSLPPALGVVVAGLVPRTGLSQNKRMGGIALLLACISVLMLHDYFQAKYR